MCPGRQSLTVVTSHGPRKSGVHCFQEGEVGEGQVGGAELWGNMASMECDLGLGKKLPSPAHLIPRHVFIP